jgi:hypothetical protein
MHVAKGDLLRVYNNIHTLLRDQHQKYIAETVWQLRSTSHHVNILFYDSLFGEVTSYALNKLPDELSRSRRPDIPRACTGTFTHTMGLPCRHVLKCLWDTCTLIEPALIHQHWFYEPLSEAQEFTAIRVHRLLTPPVSRPSVVNPIIAATM